VKPSPRKAPAKLAKTNVPNAKTSSKTSRSAQASPQVEEPSPAVTQANNPEIRNTDVVEIQENHEILFDDATLLPSGGASGYAEFEALFLRWQTSQDPAQREQLILMYRNLVVSLARRFMERGEMFEDIVQQGMIGLIYALDHFDPSRGVRFTTFATPSILGEIRRYFRDKSWGIRVPRRMQELHQIINRRIEQLTQQYDRAPTYSEIANALNLPVEDVIEVLEMAHSIEPMSLDEQASSDDGGALSSLGDSLGAYDPNLQKWNDYAPLQAAMESLPERQRIVLQAIYFEGRSQAEIARQLNVSQMYVSRAQRRALQKLKEILREGEA
jgi:RNA polymerase sigma-B factor